VSILDAPSEYAIIALHWLDAKNESFPCMGDGECKLCPGSVKVHVYTICLFWDHCSKVWLRAMADLGHPDAEFVQHDLRGQAVWIGREQPKEKRSNLKLLGTNTSRDIPPAPPTERVDARPHLMRRYGFFHEADYFERQPYCEQERLPFPIAPDEKEAS
jgi:hypothetical protein